MKIRKTKLKAVIPILLILIIAAYFRLYYMDLIEFKTDEARDAIVIKNLVEGKEFPLLGAPFSGGGRSGPVYYYLLAIPYFFVRDPVASSFFVGLLNVFAVFVVYRIGKGFFNKNVGLIASAFLAVSPYAVIYSRKIWNSDVLVPFAVLFIYFFLKFINKKNSRYFIFSIIPLAFTLQIHPTAIALPILLVLCLLFFKMKVKLKSFLISAAIFVLLFTPFIYYEVNHNFEYTKAFINYKSKVVNKGLNDLTWTHLINSSTGLNFGFFIGSSSQEFYSQLNGINNVLILVFILLLVSLVYIIKRIANRDKLTKNYIVLVLWFIIPLIILAFYSGGLYPHYHNIIIPAYFLAIVILAEKLIFHKNKFVKYASTALIILLIATDIVFLQTFFNLINKNGGAAGDYDVGYKYKFEVVNFIVKDSGSNSFKATNYLDRNELNLEYTYIFSELGKSPSSNANQEYLILNTFTTHLNSTENNFVSSYPHFKFGPMEVYKLPSNNIS